jgi:hypothetical protein
MTLSFPMKINNRLKLRPRQGIIRHEVRSPDVANSTTDDGWSMPAYERINVSLRLRQLAHPFPQLTHERAGSFLDRRRRIKCEVLAVAPRDQLHADRPAVKQR